MKATTKPQPVKARFDPDGKPKRRARKGERRCGGCDYYDDGRTITGARVDIAGCGYDGHQCRADDYAGSCTHFGGEVAR